MVSQIKPDINNNDFMKMYLFSQNQLNIQPNLISHLKSINLSIELGREDDYQKSDQILDQLQYAIFSLLKLHFPLIFDSNHFKLFKEIYPNWEMICTSIISITKFSSNYLLKELVFTSDNLYYIYFIIPNEIKIKKSKVFVYDSPKEPDKFTYFIKKPNKKLHFKRKQNKRESDSQTKKQKELILNSTMVSTYFSEFSTNLSLSSKSMLFTDSLSLSSDTSSDDTFFG
ncbi:hypothetical protein K502DRAFT_358864 [Neoconidiobolus thromboides FSU 785]|nr:hypothetical protein K502DRAFT_358864 [Neoconidiobolus thromboides FSU 785]